MREFLVSIKPNNRRNAFTLCWVCAAALLVYLVLLSADIVDHSIISIAFLLIIGTGFLIGVLKIIEPLISFELDDTGLIYYHRKGQMLVRWANTLQIGIPAISRGLDKHELAFVGIKLSDIKPVLDESSIRLFSHLVTEQRVILTQIIAAECKDGSCSGEDILDTSPVKVDGKVYKGVQAMFAHQMLLLNRFTGFHLIFPANSFDRELSETIQMLKRYRSKNLH